MPGAARYLESRSTDPYTNLAIEACLMHTVRSGQPVLYLWQNERTVVVGRNQHASAECDVERLERDGGHLARRRSGGGAVYHDLGNLNFTFVSTAEEYDQVAQTDIILAAIRALGIRAERNGRNDLVVEGGGKVSGHAYYHNGKASIHHGTIMVAVDVEALSRYLTVDPQKLSAKGVRSVRSRVTNLQALRPGTSVEELKAVLCQAYAGSVGNAVEGEDVDALDAAAVAEERRRFAAPDWLFRGERRFEETRQERFSWGSVRVDFTLREGTIADLALFTDGLETSCLDDVSRILVGARVSREELVGRLLSRGFDEERATAIAHLITS